jgi:DNA-binding transcriptional regulator GbsR (MarR family)
VDIDEYLSSIRLIERLHRQFLEVIKGELDRRGVRDVNNIQAVILYNIADEELTVGELTNRGYYLGSNVSYNVRKMVENGYLIQERSPHDRRSLRVRLSEDTLSEDELRTVNEVLARLEWFWGGAQGFGGGPR